MKHIRLFLADARRHRGLALIIVLSMLSLATIVILAFMSVADTENKATTVYASSQSARRFADSAVNIVISQIRSGAARQNPATPVIHATQPGAVRKYAANGNFLAAYKLFSDEDMIFTVGPGAIATVAKQDEERFVRESEPPADWNLNKNVARYVDMNDPVIKGVAEGEGRNTAKPQVYFPIIDPRAGQDIDAAAGVEVPVEGFSYSPTTALSGAKIDSTPPNAQTAPIVLPGPATAAGNIDQLRLAMPVQWLYILKDGATGFLDNNLKFNVLNGITGPLGPGASVIQNQYGVPSEDNPIVGRVAFWTDDETSKINVNTAAEPSFAGQPLYYHERDHRWADYPPARAEYQRFPGHPATVALSSVLYPNPLQDTSRSLDTYSLNGPVGGSQLSKVLEIKKKMYQIMPRIHDGGSVGGTRTFLQDDYVTTTGDTANATSVAIELAANERLFASVDEMLFDGYPIPGEGGSGGKFRQVTDTRATSAVTLFNKATLERASAFLTAHSRGSEINMFGMPRVAMWPLPRDKEKRTGFDFLMEFCSRLGPDRGVDNSNSYIFQRELPRFIRGKNGLGDTFDISLTRNTELLNMLDRVLTNQIFPTETKQPGAGERTFVGKMTQNNTRQLLVSMFDYIRTINLYDSYLLPQNRSEWPSINFSSVGTNWQTVYEERDRRELNSKTYTPGYIRNTSSGTNLANPFQDRSMPGHGQVTPSIHPNWTVGGGRIKGFGRFISVSEIGLHFICTADGQPDMYSWRLPKKKFPNIGKDNDDPKKFDYEIPEITPQEYQTAMTDDANPTLIVSGGRTALRADPDVDSSEGVYQIARQAEVPGFRFAGDLAQGAQISNLGAVHWAAEVGQMKQRYYSNFPPLTNPTNPGMYGTVATTESVAGGRDWGRSIQTHPGYDPRNWNWTLQPDSPLPPTKKMIQAMFNLEFFCPSVGFTEINPEFSVVISGEDLLNIEVNDEQIFNSGDVILRSNSPLFDIDGVPEIGGFASFRNVTANRLAPQRGAIPADVGYESGASGRAHAGLMNMDLISRTFEVEHGQPLRFRSSAITIRIYDRHVTSSDLENPVQIIQVQLPGTGLAPSPDLVVAPSFWVNYTQANGSIYNHPAVQAPRWWCFNNSGCIGLTADGGVPNDMRGRFFRHPNVNNNTWAVNAKNNVNSAYSQRVPGANALIYSKDAGNFNQVELLSRDLLTSNPQARIAYGGVNAPENAGIDGSMLNFPEDEEVKNYNRPWHFGSDTVRTMVPVHGDVRLIAAKYNVPATDWAPHRNWGEIDEYMAHNYSGYSAGTEPGFDRGTSYTNTQPNLTVRGLPQGVNPMDAKHVPDTPQTSVGRNAILKYYDFDDSDPGGRIGPFINKVDEGNYAIGEFTVSGWPAAKVWRATYFRAGGQGARYASSSGSYFTPNRMVPSPVVFGSLPSRVWDNNGAGAWTNLLFRPYVQYSGGGTGAATSSAATHPGEATPPDHYLLDLFWMPVVEPYAISEPLSTAGKINLNYQILPFTHIRRATAVHAAMKSEIFAALPNVDFNNSREVATNWGFQGSTAPIFHDEPTHRKYWHRGIALDNLNAGGSHWYNKTTMDERVQGTLRQFEERFNFTLPTEHRGGLFRTASQICEIHLIPTQVPTVGGNVTNVSDVNSRQTAMATFWANHCATGDNTRERPYANLYNKFTTRSNTFRVHVRAQSIRKALRSVAADTFDPDLDQVGAEFRGSFLLERYIDQADLTGANVDYAKAANPMALKPLEDYYRFRVLESKRFAP